MYLMAVNAFAALATVRTADTLPVLVDAFLNESRAVAERVNVGEVIVQLSKRLGKNYFGVPSERLMRLSNLCVCR